METSAEELERESQEEAQRLVEVLKILYRMLGYRSRDLERRAKLNHATAVRVFAGDSEPRLQFILAMVRAMGLEYWEFFELAYADRSAEASAAGQKLRSLLESMIPGRSRAKQEEPKLDIKKMIEDFRQEVQGLLEERAKARNASASPPPPQKSSPRPKSRGAKKGEG